MSLETPEELLIDLEWSALTEQEKTELILRQTIYIETSRKFVHALAVHGTDVRNLMLNMMIVLTLSLFNVDTRNTILALLGTQLFFTVISKLISLGVLKQLEDLRKAYIQFIKDKKSKNV